MSDTTYFNIKATGSTGDNSCGPCLKVIRREYEARIAALRSLVESLEEVKAEQKARIATLEAQVEQAREALEVIANALKATEEFPDNPDTHGNFGPLRRLAYSQAIFALQALREGGEDADT